MIPSSHASSPGVVRKFCPRCGSPLSYETEERPDDVDLYAASLDDHSTFVPMKHVFWAEHVAWVKIGRAHV